jgi:hypothetical protein
MAKVIGISPAKSIASTIALRPHLRFWLKGREVLGGASQESKERFLERL